MSKKLLHSITVMFVAFALLFTTTSQAFASSNSKSEGEVEGTISAVSASSISVTPKKGGADVTVNVDAATRIRRDGKVVLISVLQMGDKVSVKYNKTTMLASRVDAKAKKTSDNSNSSSNKNGEVNGVISSVGAGTVTITPKKGGAAITISVDGTTRIKRNGKTVDAGGLQAGDKVEVKYNKTTMLASKIEAKGVKINGNSNTNSNSNSSDDNSNSSNSNSNTNSNTAP
jgi:hypothetical protein